MLCRNCPWNDYRKAGVLYCMLPRCLHQVERGEGSDRKTEEILRGVSCGLERDTSRNSGGVQFKNSE